MSPEESPTGSTQFSESAQRVVDYLNRNTPLTDWSVTRVAGGEQVHLHVHHEELLEVGTQVEFSDGFCFQMVNGAAPVVVDTLADPDYSHIPQAQQARSYAGVPLTDDHGELFGVLCGFGTEPLADVGDVDQDLVGLMGDLLSTHLVTARTADRSTRDSQVALALAQTDALTGLTNRRGWDVLVADAQTRIDAYGDLVAILVIDLDGLKEVNDTGGHAAGDDLLVRAAAALQGAAGEGDRLARYGGDEFAVLANSIGNRDVAEHTDRFRSALATAGIDASVGHAVTRAGVTSVVDAFAAADRAMYQEKSGRKSSP